MLFDTHAHMDDRAFDRPSGAGHRAADEPRMQSRVLPGGFRSGVPV